MELKHGRSRFAQMLNKITPAFTILLVLPQCFALWAAEGTLPSRQVHANVITSESDPKIQIELPKNVQYVGADRWILFDVADCELHLFVQADAQKLVQRFYWLQFEAYLPSRPELKHTYPMTKTETINGMLFDVRARFGLSGEKPKPGSDLEHVETLLLTHGFRLPEATMNVRLVHLLDEQKRKELMIIYAEDLKLNGLTVDDLTSKAGASGTWPQIEKGLIERAKASVHFHL